MGRTRPVVVVGVLLLFVGAIGLAYVQRAQGEEPWEDAAIEELAFSEDRRTIRVLASEFRSASCYEHRVTVDRDSSEWAIQLQARRIDEFCTLEGCIPYEAFTLAADPEASGSCPPVHELSLDQPAPAAVELVVAD